MTEPSPTANHEPLHTRRYKYVVGDDSETFTFTTAPVTRKDPQFTTSPPVCLLPPVSSLLSISVLFLACLSSLSSVSSWPLLPVFAFSSLFRPLSSSIF